MKILILALKLLKSLFGNEKLFEAFNEISERKTKIKLTHLTEQEEIRELKNDLKETKLRKRLKRRQK